MLRYSNLTAKVLSYFLCFYFEGPIAEGKDDPQLRRFYCFRSKKGKGKTVRTKKIIEYNRMEKGGRFLFLPIRRSQSCGSSWGRSWRRWEGLKKR